MSEKRCPRCGCTNLVPMGGGLGTKRYLACDACGYAGPTSWSLEHAAELFDDLPFAAHSTAYDCEKASSREERLAAALIGLLDGWKALQRTRGVDPSLDLCVQAAEDALYGHVELGRET